MSVVQDMLRELRRSLCQYCSCWALCTVTAVLDVQARGQIWWHTAAGGWVGWDPIPEESSDYMAASAYKMVQAGLCS